MKSREKTILNFALWLSFFFLGQGLVLTESKAENFSTGSFDNCTAIYRNVTLWCQGQAFNHCQTTPVDGIGLTLRACSHEECLSKAQEIANQCQRNRSEQSSSEESDDGEAFGSELPQNGPIPGHRPAQQGRKRGGGSEGNTAGTDSKESNSDNSTQGDYSQAALQREVQTCNSNSQDANKCCNNPAACGVSSGSSGITPPPSNDPEGMKAYCEQMKYASNSGRSSNADAAGVCFTRRNGCNISCGDSKKKWEAYLPNCRAPNCDPSRLNQALGIFNAKVSECGKLEANERVLSAQSSSNYQDAQAAQQCANQASQDQAAQMANAAQQPQQDSSNLSDAGVDCNQYPNSPSCYQQQQAQNQYAGNDAFSTDAGSGSASMSDFNTGSSSDGLDQFPQFAAIDPQAAQGKAIPNGGGGFIGGGSGGGSGFDTSSGGAGEKGGYKTDILDGTTGGGGGASGSKGDPSAISGGGGYGGYGSRNQEFQNAYQGLDLKQYLPGGEKDPKRGLASATTASATGHADIIPMGESMFKRISNRLQLMCKLKQLMGCE